MAKYLRQTLSEHIVFLSCLAITLVQLKSARIIVYNKVFSSRSIYWVKILSKFLSAQLLVQVLGFASGILLIRTLSKQEYAYFTLANSMQGTINVLANSGISSALFSIGGKIWQDSNRLGQLVATAMKIRRYLAFIVAIVVIPFMMWMLLKNGASVQYSLFLVIGILIELHFYLNDGVMIVVPRLHSQFNRLQNIDIIFAISRISLLLLSSLTVLNAAIGIFVSSVASGLKNKLLFTYIKDTIKIDAPVNKEYKKGILEMIRYHAPESIFYCFQGQLLILLISIFGHTDNIAEIGALARVSVIFSLINSVIINIIMPSFARCKTDLVFLVEYFKIISIIFLLCLIFLLLINFYPHVFLYILGNKYQHLENELLFISLLNVTQFIVKFLWMTNSSRGWIREAWFLIPSTIMTQAFLLMSINVSTLRGVILFSTYSTIPAFIINLYMTYRGVKEWRLQLDNQTKSSS